MGCNRHNFCIKRLDEKMKTYDNGITVVFQITNVFSKSDRHPKVIENRYYMFFDDILECDCNSFRLVLFSIKWYKLWMNERDSDRTFIQHSNGFTMVNTRNVELGPKPYVLPSQCEHAFYSEVPSREGWWYVIRYDPRGRLVKYIVAEEYYIEE